MCITLRVKYIRIWYLLDLVISVVSEIAKHNQCCCVRRLNPNMVLPQFGSVPAEIVAFV